MMSLAGAVSVLLGMPSAGMAQINAPLTVTPDVAGPPVQVSAPAPVVLVSSPEGPPPAPVADAVSDSDSDSVVAPEAVGDATRRLLALQAQTQRPGTPHEVLGATAGRSWQRYLDSFEHPIPNRFENEVETGDTR